MNDELLSKIENSTAHKKSRDELSDYLIKNPDLIFDTISFCFAFKHKNHYKAAWNLEIVAVKKPVFLAKYSSLFSDKIHLITNESALRSVSGIVLRLLLYSEKSKNKLFDFTEEEKLIAAAFDWLLGNAKVATKANAMKILSILGKEHDWIYPELQIIFAKDASKHSIGYKACAKNILKEIDKFSK